MAKYAANALRNFLDLYAISGFVNSSDLTISQETPVVTCFSDAGPRRVPGNYDVQHVDNGFFDGVALRWDDLLAGLLDNDDHYLGKCPEGSAENAVAYESIVALTGKPLSAQTAGATLLHLQSAGRGGVFRGLVLASMTTTGAENRTGRNMGVTTAPAEFAVVFRLLTFSGTNITISVQESSDNGSGDAYAAIAGLTSGALTAAGVVRASTVATTEAWKRVNIAGTFTTALVLVTAGTVQGT